MQRQEGAGWVKELLYLLKVISKDQHLPTGLRNGGLGMALTGFNW